MTKHADDTSLRTGKQRQLLQKTLQSLDKSETAATTGSKGELPAKRRLNCHGACISGHLADH